MEKYLRIVMLGCLLIPLLASAGTPAEIVPFKRSVTKTFNVNDGAQVSINNKYGKVNLHTWNKNQVQAVITITADGRTAEDAQQLAGRVSIRSDQSANNISFATEYESSSSSSFWGKFFGLSQGNNKKLIHIDYEIYLPQSLRDLNIHNDYGGVTGNNISGNISLNLNYSNFHLDKINGTVDFHGNYCDGTLSNVKIGVIHANYTNFHLGQIENLDVNSNYSDYKISSAGQLKFSTNYGDVSAENIKSLTSGSNYTDFTINRLLGKANMKITYGDVRLKTLGNEFRELMVKGTYANVSVGIPDGIPLRIDINLSQGDIHTNGLALQHVEKSDEHGKKTLKATSSSGGAGSALIQVSGTYTDVSLSGK